MTDAEQASEQDIAIARAVLAGWQLVQLGTPDCAPLYRVRSPNGTTMAFRSTRYTAALYVLDYIAGVRA